MVTTTVQETLLKRYWQKESQASITVTSFGKIQSYGRTSFQPSEVSLEGKQEDYKNKDMHINTQDTQDKDIQDFKVLTQNCRPATWTKGDEGLLFSNS